jgi:intraflagellar transport protein 140
MSSIYFDNVLPLNEAAVSARCIAWSHGEDTPFLAVTEGTSVRIFREEGEEVLEAAQSRMCGCTSLAWHPQAKVLAAGWEDGAVTLTVPGTTSSREDREVHRDGSILCIAFNPAGSRCITTDSQGVVAVWKTDAKGTLNQMCHYRKSGSHDKVIFRTATPAGEDNPPFFFGGELGTIYLADDFGLCSERYKIGSPLALLEYYHQKDMVVVITKSVLLAQFSLDAEGKVVNETKLKLSCGPHPERLQGVWAGPGLLATVSHESIVRLWNLADDESYILSLQGIDERNSLAGDKLTSIDFNPRKRVLATGTRGGRIVQWRCSTLSGTPKGENSWQVLPVINASEAPIEKLSVGPGESLVHIRTEKSSIILSEAQLNTAVQPPFMAVQTAPMQVLVYNMERQTRCAITAPFRVRGVSIAGNFVMLWNSKQVTTYELDPVSMSMTVHSSFNHESSPIVAAVLLIQGAERTVAAATGSKIEFINLQGHVQKTLAFSPEVEGVPTCLDVNGCSSMSKGEFKGFLVASTSRGVIKVWNVSRREPKQVSAARKFEGVGETSLGEIRSVRINSDGTRVSLLVDQRLPGGVHGSNTTLRVPDSRLFLYDLESDGFLTYFVGKSRVPVAHSWECTDPRLVAVEVVPQALAYSNEDETSDALAPAVPSTSIVVTDDEPSHTVMTLFASGSDQLLLQDSVSCADPENNGAPRMPVALIVPHLYFARQLGDVGGAESVVESDGAPAVISRSVLRDFAGLENVDADTTAALLDFSFHLACGNTDEAYKSVKGVQSTGVWESMSKMCVKTGRLDVAQECLGRMSHARAAGQVRACEEPEPEARLAVVAVHLDMVEDAEYLLKRCGRFDLLNQLYQACGEWEKALEVAKTKDRVHLKPTHFAYAQHLEAIEDVQGALSHFELSGTYRTESPRLLCSLGLTDDLEAYVEQSDDTHLHRWYAQYLESKANLEGAAREYKKAGDWLSLCRVACFNKDLERAEKICQDSQDPAACYHLARHLEAEGRVKEAIKFFQLAGRISHALRLAQENSFDGDIMHLALASDPANMAAAAKHYEQSNQPTKAVTLYQKAGYQKRALELCFNARLFDSLRKIADDLCADSDPEILAKCAEFFMQHNQHEKAVHLLSMSHQYMKAVELCTQHEEVQITEEMAERMTPEKNSMDPQMRSQILNDIAKLCKKQGSFQLACKKFTQAGDKSKAMKSLLKSGDTEKIIFFAGTARQPEIYVLAGNYLQSLDWHNDPEIMKNIIQFYSKAKAHDKLASFYDACAQVEIDEYRDYEKAGGALREALKYIVKAAGGPPGSDGDPRVQALNSRIQIVDRFASIRKLGKTNPEEMVQVCEQMLQMGDIESAVRIGDIFAQLVEHYSSDQNYPEAHRAVEQMRSRGIILTPYLDRALIENIYKGVGLPMPDTGEAAAGHGQQHGAGMVAQPAESEIDDGVGEEIDEEM